MADKKYSVEIENINSLGQGVGKLNGKIVFVQGGVPGDNLLVKNVSERKKYTIAKIVKVIKSSPARINPHCSVAKNCGGCSLSHMKYSEQMIMKESIVMESMIRIGGFQRDLIKSAQERIIEAENRFFYRNKVQIPVSGSAEIPELGFYEAGSHKIVDANECIVQNKAADIVRRIVRNYVIKEKILPYDEKMKTGIIRHLVVRTGNNTGEIMVVIVLKRNDFPEADNLIADMRNELGNNGYKLMSFYLNINSENTNVVLGKEYIHLYGKKKIKERISEMDFIISPDAFFQVNTSQAEKLFYKVKEISDISENDVLFDLYCGTGFFSLLMAKHCKEVYGIEINENAILDANENKRINEIENAYFFNGRAEKLYPEMVSKGIYANTVILDPPRKGADIILLDTITNQNPGKIIYISCNPSTLARDCKEICKKNKYKIKKIVPVDMFPWTHHVETVVLMSRK